MRYILMTIFAMLMFVGCSTKQAPKPVVVVDEVEKPKPIYHAPRKRGVVPPLPKREEDIDVDSAVDSAMDDLLPPE
jgi:hypothetical protein